MLSFGVKAAFLTVSFLAGMVAGGEIATRSVERLNREALERTIDESKEYQARLDAALLERDKARSEAAAALDDNRALVARLRGSDGGSAGADGSFSVCQRHLSECRELLAEALELAGEGESMARQFDADRAAARKVK